MEFIIYRKEEEVIHYYLLIKAKIAQTKTGAFLPEKGRESTLMNWVFWT